ncbi:hypothetical protein pCPXV0179 [Cowpox virus]|uniref:Uncharacterized protein n=1 Tax=Cowpox virus TaxID=10243 RepID=A0A212PNM7_COWPX|nr:hypothetical protein pCPXV0179 [Cowpox virus]SNB48521.1 hypothetical protein pCPXV0179 [Cowpox virus]
MVNFCISDAEIGINDVIVLFPVNGLVTAPSVLYPLEYFSLLSSILEHSMICLSLILAGKIDFLFFIILLLAIVDITSGKYFSTFSISSIFKPAIYSAILLLVSIPFLAKKSYVVFTISVLTGSSISLSTSAE